MLDCAPAAGAGAPGAVLEGFIVACGEGALRLTRLQRAGKAVMTADELLRGFAPEILE